MNTATRPTICDFVAKMSTRPMERPAYRTKSQGFWKNVTWAEYFDQVQALACSFLDAGLAPGETVVVMSNTRWEWSVTDLAVMGLQAITVPIYQSATADEVEFVLIDSKARFVVLENRAMLKTFLSIRERCPGVERVYLLERIRDEDSEFYSWHNALKHGETVRAKFKNTFLERLESATLEQTATLLYTSGTTGRAKGVVLTHAQIMSEIAEAFPFAGVHADDVSLTFLPYAHVLGRIEHWGHVYIGFTMAFAESLEKMRLNLTEIRPTIMVAVPRIFEKVYTAVQTQIEANPLKKRMFQQALMVGQQVSASKMKRQPLSMALKVSYQVAQKFVLSNVRNAFGGRLRFAICGGAPISTDIIRFFHACDILILEGYGLTETTGAITVNTPYDYEFGTVGKPIGDTQIKIAEDGEILIRSKKVMKEYYQNPEDTAKTITDGWFHTGDIGEISASGNLRITDRKKDLIKTAGGKYVAPQQLENLLKNNPMISQALIHGDQKKYIVALLTLDRPLLEKFAIDRDLKFSSFDELTQHHLVLESIRKSVADANSQLASYQSIKRFAILPTEFSLEAGELTPSLKIKRKFVAHKYQNQIEKLYS